MDMVLVVWLILCCTFGRRGDGLAICIILDHPQHSWYHTRFVISVCLADRPLTTHHHKQLATPNIKHPPSVPCHLRPLPATSWRSMHNISAPTPGQLVNITWSHVHLLVTLDLAPPRPADSTGLFTFDLLHVGGRASIPLKPLVSPFSQYPDCQLIILAFDYGGRPGPRAPSPTRPHSSGKMQPMSTIWLVWENENLLFPFTTKQCFAARPPS